MANSNEVGSVMSRNTPVTAGKNHKDSYRQWLISKGASTAGGSNIRALEKSFFAANGGSGRYYSELMGTFLAAKGFTGGRSLQDNWRRFLASGSV